MVTSTTAPVGAPTPINPGTTPSGSPPPTGVDTTVPPAVSAGQLTSDQTSAKAMLTSFFRDLLGLPGLTDWAWQKYLKGDSVAQIEIESYETPEFKTRFPAYDARAKAGRPITPAEYVSFEQRINEIEQQYGLPKGMYSNPDQITKMINHNVSALEAEQRAQEATVAALQAPASVRQAFADQFGVGIGGITALFLDADRAKPMLEQEYAKAQVIGAGTDTGVTIDQATAARLAARGVDYGSAYTGLGQVAATSALGGGFGETVDTATRIAGQFGDTAAQRAQTRVQRGRLAAFRGGGQLVEAQGGVAGLGASSTT